MADENHQRYELGRLILDYLRIFMWPSIILVFAVLYWEDLIEVIKGREVNIFGVEIGPAVVQLQETTKQELADVEALVAKLEANFRRELETAIEGQPSSASTADASEQTREAAQALETKLSSLRANLDRETQAIRDITLQQSVSHQAPVGSIVPEPVSPTSRSQQAAALERAGFEAVLAHRIDDALDAFEGARDVWPDFHNVDEIAHYLSDLRADQAPLDEADWAAIERTILTRYSWGMPTDLRERFRERATAVLF